MLTSNLLCKLVTNIQCFGSLFLLSVLRVSFSVVSTSKEKKTKLLLFTELIKYIKMCIKKVFDKYILFFL